MERGSAHFKIQFIFTSAATNDGPCSQTVLRGITDKMREANRESSSHLLLNWTMPVWLFPSTWENPRPDRSTDYSDPVGTSFWTRPFQWISLWTGSREETQERQWLRCLKWGSSQSSKALAPQRFRITYDEMARRDESDPAGFNQQQEGNPNLNKTGWDPKSII